MVLRRLPSAAGLRTQTGVNSHLTLAHISTSTEAKTPSRAVNSTFPTASSFPGMKGTEGATGALPPRAAGGGQGTLLCPFYLVYENGTAPTLMPWPMSDRFKAFSTIPPYPAGTRVGALGWSAVHLETQLPAPIHTVCTDSFSKGATHCPLMFTSLSYLHRLGHMATHLSAC